MLHIIDQFPLQPSFLEKTHSGDTVILKDTAVYAAKYENIKEPLFAKTLAHINLCVSKADLLLHNISTHELIRGVAIIDELRDEQNELAQNFVVRSYN